MNDLFAPNIKKWNFNTHEYEPYDPPEGHIVFMTDDMDMDINCTGCGKEVKFGKTFTSRKLHNAHGLAWPVCEDCYETEWSEERAAKANEDTEKTV